MSEKKKILISVLGTSPSVLTETVWALATSDPSVVPDDIVVLTTLTGKRKLEEQILNGENSVWTRLLAALTKKGIDVANKLAFGSSSSIQIFAMGSKDLNDITTPEENMAAADFILKTIRSYSENPNTQIFASVAGGRKTMSALMLSCMSLLARAEDHVLHVLVNEPFDGGVEPPFYFPDGGTYLVRRTQETLPAARAKIDLIDLPFVKVRALYEGRYGERVPSYVELVRGTQNSPALGRPLIELNFETGTAVVDGKPIKIPVPEFVALSVLLCQRPSSLTDFHRCMCALRKRELAATGDWSTTWLAKFLDGTRFTNDDEESRLLKDYTLNSTKVLSELRKKLKAVSALAPYVDEIAPKRLEGVSYPAERISADIRILHAQFK